MKILVTGAAGFIGSHLVDLLLSKNIKVVGIDNFEVGRKSNIEHNLKNINFSFFKCDICDFNSLENYVKNIDGIIHLAALADIVPSINNPEAYFNTNVNGTFNLLILARKYHVSRFIYAASSSCYGIPTKFPTNENASIMPMYPYALTKRLGEELVMHWLKLYKMTGISLRLFNVYGPRARTSGTYGAVFGVFLAQKIAKKPFTVVGDGTQTRDFTYVSDVANAFYNALISDKKNLILNVGSGGTYSVNKICELLGGDKVFIPKRPGEPDCTFADISQIKTHLNWEPKIDIETGVNFLLNDIEKFKDAPLWDKESIKEATSDWFKYLSN